MGTLPQALEIIFEVQRKRINGEKKKLKKKIPTYKTFFFPLFSFWTLPTFKLHNFLMYILFNLSDLQCYRNAT
jgi:hypothetical protein